MSFARSKSAKKNEKEIRFSNNNFNSSNVQPNFLNNFNQRLSQARQSKDKVSNKLEIIEFNINRVINQHEALLPLIDVKNQLLSLEKIEKQLNTYIERTNANKLRIKNLTNELSKDADSQGVLEKFRRKEKNLDFLNLERNVKGTANLVNILQNNLKDVESTISNVQRNNENKLKDLYNEVNKEVEGRSDKNLEEIKKIMNEFENYIQMSLREKSKVLKELYPENNDGDMKEDSANEFDKEKIKKEINAAIQVRIQECIEDLRNKYEKDLNSLYTEIGCLKCELNILNVDSADARGIPIFDYSHESTLENKIKYECKTQNFMLDELDYFNKRNTQRLIDDLKSVEENVLTIRALILNEPKKYPVVDIKLKEDLEFLNEKFKEMKYEIEGTKKKYLLEMKSLEERMDKLNILRKTIINENSKNLKNKVNEDVTTIESFPEKIKNQMESINKNLELIYKNYANTEQMFCESKNEIRKLNF